MESHQVEARAFRQVMGRFPTGVTVVTARDGEGAPLGLTVNAFTSVSLDPPLVLVCVDRDARSHDQLLRASCFAVNLLARSQSAVARRFASDPPEGRFDGVAWREGPGGAPVLEGTAGWLECSPEEAHRAGDHTILVGRVRAGEVGDADALAFYRGTFGAVVPP